MNRAALSQQPASADPLGADRTGNPVVDLTWVNVLNLGSQHAPAVFALLLKPGPRLALYAGRPVIGRMPATCGWDDPDLPLTRL